MLFHPTNDSYMHNMHMPLKSISSHGFFPPTKTSKISPSRKDSDSVAESSQSRSAQSRTTSRTPVSRQVGKPMDRYGSVGRGCNISGWYLQVFFWIVMACLLQSEGLGIYWKDISCFTSLKKTWLTVKKSRTWEYEPALIFHCCGKQRQLPSFFISFWEWTMRFKSEGWNVLRPYVFLLEQRTVAIRLSFCSLQGFMQFVLGKSYSSVSFL
jgi:hypothetical protein